MAAATHIIGRQNIRVRYNGETDVLALRSQISRVCSDELPVRLNKLFDAYDEEDYVLRIDKLDIHVNISVGDNLQETLAKAIIEKVEAALRSKLEQKMTRGLTLPDSFAQALRFYLEKGYLPWWSFAKDAFAFQQSLESTWDNAFLKNVITEILPVLQSTSARTRLVALLNEAQFTSLILKMEGRSGTRWREWEACIDIIYTRTAKKINRINIQRLYRLALLEVMILQPEPKRTTLLMAASIIRALKQQGILITGKTIASIPFPEIREAFLTTVQTEILPEEITLAIPTEAEALVLGEAEKKFLKVEAKPLPEEEESIFIANAGLVLLASYLPAYFRNTGILSEGKPQNISRAIVRLRYLAYGNGMPQEFEEFEVVLEKLLCGITLSESIPERHTLSEEEKEQSDELLQSVIENWKVLKNTSPDGLRHNFIQREGLLLFKKNQWELSIQKQAHDILLDYLPWNIGMIKLPWMPHLMIVKWNT